MTSRNTRIPLEETDRIISEGVVIDHCQLASGEDPNRPGCRNGNLWCDDPRCHPHCTHCEPPDRTLSTIIIIIFVIFSIGLVVFLIYLLRLDDPESFSWENPSRNNLQTTHFSQSSPGGLRSTRHSSSSYTQSF